MQSAFDFYALENKESKGTKRKLDSASVDEEVDGVDNSDDGSPSKRRRFVNRYITRSNFKRIGRVVGTALIAVGFYQLTHYLPASIQTYLN